VRYFKTSLALRKETQGGAKVRARFTRVWPSLLLTSVLLSPAVQAQGLPCPQQTVPVSVSASDGRVVLGLTASNFRVRVNGHTARILDASMDSSPRRIVLLLDASGSMLTPERTLWKPALAVSKTLLERLRPQDSVAFLAFANQVERKVDFTRDPKSALQQVDELESGTKAIRRGVRKTALWDSVLEALRLFDSARAGDSIYVISDGNDNHSHASRSDAEKALLAARVRFFALLPPAPANVRYEWASLGSFQGPATLEDVSDTTGGAFFRLSNELDVALNPLKALTEQFYRVEVELPQSVDKSLNWQFEIVGQIDNGKLPPLLRYPRKVGPCGTRER
jgi:VWFA-related protein